MININSLINRKAVVTRIYDGLGYQTNDSKYTGKAYNQVVKLVALVPETKDFYITDYFIPEFIEENNDYIHYGFLKVSTGNITLLEIE
jgi:hypothetical protein